MERYSEYKPSIIQWLDEIPSHWSEIRAKYLFKKESRIPDDGAEVITCFRDGTVTLRKNRRTTGFTESLKEIGYQGIKKGDLVIHQMDAFAGASGVSDSDGKGTPVYSVCTPLRSDILNDYYGYVVRMMGINGFIQSLYRGIRERSSDFRFDTFSRQTLPLPPLGEQERIVSFIKNVINKIDLYISEKEKEIKLYEELIESYILSGGEESNKEVYSWESIFPNDWNLISGKGLFEEIQIKGISTERFLAVTQDSGLIYKDTEEVNYVTAAKKETQKLICPGQFVISLRSFQGGIEYSDKKGLISPAYVVIKLIDKYDDLEHQMYYRFLLKSKPYIELLGSLSDSMRDGKSIKFNDIKYFKYPIPTKDSLKKIHELVRIYDVKKEALREMRKFFSEYKVKIISDAISGQINVQNF